MKFKAISLGLVSALLVAGAISYFYFPAVRAQSSSLTRTAPPKSSMITPMPMPLAMPQSAYAGLWRVDRNFVSTIHIKNLMATNSVRVTPVLYLADGTEYDLPPISLSSTAVADVSVNYALQEAPSAFTSRAPQYGSAELKYIYSAPGVVAGDVTMVNVPRSLIFTDSFEMPMMPMMGQSAAKQTLEGLWWKHDPDVGGFVSFANTTSNSENVSYRVTGAHGLALPPQSLTLAPHATQILDLDEMIDALPGTETQAGGIRVQYKGQLGDVEVGGGLENDREGYSADMPFWQGNSVGSANFSSSQKTHHNHRSAAGAFTLAAVGLMAGYPDPSMGFPASTYFTPYLALRNTTSKPITVTPVLYLAGASRDRRLPLPAEALEPYEARQVDMATRIQTMGLRVFNGMMNLTVTYVGASVDVVMAAGSVDQTGNYVFAVLPQGVNQGMARDIPGWTVANGYDTMFALWNPSSQAEDLVATFHSPNGSEQYQLPIHLGARASMNIDMAQLIALGEPDENGNTFPAGITSGSVTFSSPEGVKGMVELAVNAAEFNVTTGTCGFQCICCAGVTSCVLLPGTIYVLLNGTGQAQAYAEYTDGTEQDVTTSSSWQSSSTSVISVSGPGLLAGQALGSATITASEDLCPGGQICNVNPVCPTYSLMQGEGGGQVTSSPVVQISSVFASTNPATSPVTINTTTAPTSATITVDVFHTSMGSIQNPQVTAQIGTYNATPGGNNIAYNPTSQSNVNVGGSSPTVVYFTASPSQVTTDGSVTVQATITSATSGITIQAPNPASAAQTTIKTTTK